MKIQITKGKYCFIDKEDYEKFKRYKWYAHSNNRRWYVRGSRYINGVRKRIYLHNLIKPIKIKNKELDHINRNTLDNRKQNLRYVTRSLNNFNSKTKVGGSRFKGVYWNTSRRRWIAKINYKGRQYHLGTFTNEVCAAQAYDAAAVMIAGTEIPYLNFRIKI